MNRRSFGALPSEWLTFLLLSAWLARPPALAFDIEAVRTGLRAREQALDRIKVTYTWDPRRVPLKRDPFDPNNWIHEPNWAKQMGPLYQCEMWIVRPHFRWYRSSALSFDREQLSTWIDGVTQTRCFSLEDRSWSVVIDDDRWRLFGPAPVLTPFEMQVCDIQDSLLQLLDRDELRVESETGDRVVLAGSPTINGQATPWTVRASLDPSRGWLPLELHAEVPHGARSKKKIDWTVRTIDSIPVRGAHAIREMIFALNNQLDDKGWQIYHFVASSITADDSLSKDDLRVEIPTENLKLLDENSGLQRFTDDEGRVIHQEVKTPEQRERELQAVRQSFAMGQEARQVRSTRQYAFYGVASAAGFVTVLAAGVWWWRRQHLAAA